MATVKALQDVAAMVIDTDSVGVAVVGVYESDGGQWVNVKFRHADEKIAFEIEVFGRAIMPDEVLDDGLIQVHKRHFLN